MGAIMSRSEVAEYLGIHGTSVDKLVREGKLKRLKAFDSPYFSTKEVEELTVNGKVIENLNEKKLKQQLADAKVEIEQLRSFVKNFVGEGIRIVKL
ncbi:DNA-binding protein [Clostridium cellulovorans]|nr:DNA-binding protein [Clostridium cellulovorans]